METRIDLALVTAKAPLRALADVILSWPEGEITIRRCAVFEKPGEPPWANLPRLPVDKDGKRIYVPLIEMQRNLKQRVLDAVLDAYRKKVICATTSSPGGAAQECGATSVGPDDPTTADGSGHQGPLTAGAGGKGSARRLGSKRREGPPSAALLNLRSSRGVCDEPHTTPTSSARRMHLGAEQKRRMRNGR